MKLVVLGSGTAFPHPTRCSPGFWLETAEGSAALDFGPTVPHRLAQEKLDWASLDSIWISHFHLDHVGGLAPFFFGTRNAVKTRERSKPLRVFGPAELEALMRKFDASNNYKLFRQPFPLEFIEIRPLEKFQFLKDVEAVAVKTPHTAESLALHVSAPNTTLVYTSDTGFDEGLAAAARNVDLLLIECSFVRDKPVKGHLELAEAMHLIRRASPKRAMLTHLYSEWDSVDFQSEVRKFDPGCEVIEAVDGLSIEL